PFHSGIPPHSNPEFPFVNSPCYNFIKARNKASARASCFRTIGNGELRDAEYFSYDTAFIWKETDGNPLHRLYTNKRVRRKQT
ncbi:hypothetical protein, partial [uncultured Clostridium sp.]|uniref:hypothetical protein n=1 Tax=uncultured Clostridium sp. TaxID=59620 RepID=UPI0025903F8E